MEENFTIPPGVLSDLCSRFIINVPEEERTDLIRMFFQIEIAHWFYLDFYCDSQFLSSSSSQATSLNQTTKSLTPTPNGTSLVFSEADESNDNIIQQQQTQLLKPCSIRIFAENIFRHCPFLMQYSNQVDDILSKWKVFKHAVPTNGAIVLDETMRYVLLVQGFWAKASWGFPKGKVVEEESEAKCAIREVLEETGYDISSKLNENHYLEVSINDQTIRLYIITNVSKTTKFEPRTRREIKEVRWFAIDELPVHRKDTRSKQTLGYSPNSFFMVIPFLKALKQWIANNSNNNNNNHSSSANSNSAGKINNQRSHSTINHQRHNSHTNNNGHHHHHHHHTHHHSKTIENFNDSSRKMNSLSNHNKQLSKSNDSISSLQNHSLNNNNSNSQKKFNKSNNTFLRQHSVNFNFQSNNNSKNESDDNSSNKRNFKQQNGKQSDTQIYSNSKELALTNKTNKINNTNQQIKSLNGFNQLGTNSKFKPVNLNNNNINSNNINNENNYKKQLSSNVSVPNGLNNVVLSSNKKYNKDNTLKNSTSFYGTANNSINNYNNNIYHHNKNSDNITKVKKHLEFNGPECWINFKFDYDSIIQSLPMIQ